MQCGFKFPQGPRRTTTLAKFPRPLQMQCTFWRAQIGSFAIHRCQCRLPAGIRHLIRVLSSVPTAQLAKEWPSCHSNALADSVHSVAKRITRARFLFLNTLSCADSEVQVLVKAVAQISGLSLRESRFRVRMT